MYQNLIFYIGYSKAKSELIIKSLEKLNLYSDTKAHKWGHIYQWVLLHFTEVVLHSNPVFRNNMHTHSHTDTPIYLLAYPQQLALFLKCNRVNKYLPMPKITYYMKTKMML